MKKALRKITRKVLLAPMVKSHLESVYGVTEIKGNLEAFIKHIGEAFGRVLDGEGKSDLAEAILQGDAAALQRLDHHIISQFAEIKGRLGLIEAFVKDRAEASKSGERPDLAEASSPGDAKALEQLVNMAKKDNTKGCLVAEIGSWKGMSTSVLAKGVANCGGKVFAIDHWMGNERTWNYEIARTYDIYSIFKKNMVLLGIWNIVHPMVMDSETASQIFADGILDLVFIDADHRYEHIKKDISLWLPKLKGGGLLCGHDCEGYYPEYPEKARKLIEDSLEDDYVFDIGVHPGVVKALYEHFGKNYSIMPDSVVWYYIKGAPSQANTQ